MRTFYTARDIDEIAAKGIRQVALPQNAVLTDEAADRAARLGVEIRFGCSPTAAESAVAGNGSGPSQEQDVSLSSDEVAAIVRSVLASLDQPRGNGNGSLASNRRQLLVAGRWQDSATGKTLLVMNPANNEVIAEVSEGDQRDVAVAVAAAKKAFESGPWPRMTATERGMRLQKVAELIRQRAEKLALLETTNCGKPISQTTYVDVPATADTFEFYAGAPTKIHGRTIPVPGNFLNYTMREPLGVVGIIVPWNFPLLIGAWKLAPALAAGNTVVLKPSSLTPLSALELGQICLDAGIPEGVVNVVVGPGATVGNALVEHPDISKIAFTGETTTGREIARVGSNSIKKITLELGGKSPNIVFDDADIDRAVAGSLFAIYLNSGEVCAAGSRLLLHERIRDAFLERFVARAQRIRVGDPLRPETQMGPLISAPHLEKVKGYVQSALDDGAGLLTGGRSPSDPECARGNYLLPTVFDGVHTGMRIAREEIFGPVVAVLTFRDEEEAIEIANGTIYGLAAGIWTRDVGRAHNVASRLKVGNIWVNTYNLVPVEAPFGGYKQSGVGRDLGLDALDGYLQTKNVCVDLSEKGLDYFSL